MPSGSDIKKLQRSITRLQDRLEFLGKVTELRELLKVIRRPGWTTPAEFILVSGILDSMTAHANALIDLRSDLLRGARRVGRG